MFEHLNRTDSLQNVCCDRFLDAKMSEPPRKKAKTAQGVEDEADEAALSQVAIEQVPAHITKLLKEAADELDLRELKPRDTPFGQTKRTQATYGHHCAILAYSFSKHQSPILEAQGPLLDLIQMYAKERAVDLSACMVHVNHYPAGTQAGVDAHQDDEPIIDQAHPIVAYQTGSSAMLHVWSGKPKGRAGARVEISESQSYTMPAGFQLANFHAIKRQRKRHVATSRISFTFRVVKK